MRPVYRLSAMERTEICRSAAARLTAGVITFNLQTAEGRRAICLHTEISGLTTAMQDMLNEMPTARIGREQAINIVDRLLSEYDIDPAWLPGGFAQQLNEEVMARVLRWLDLVFFAGVVC